MYLYLDRRIFSKTHDMSNLNAFLSAAPPNAAVEYIRAVTGYGTDNSRSLHKASCSPLCASRGKGGGRAMRRAGPVTYQTGMGKLEQAGLARGDRMLDAQEAARGYREPLGRAGDGSATDTELWLWAHSEEDEEGVDSTACIEGGDCVAWG